MKKTRLSDQAVRSDRRSFVLNSVKVGGGIAGTVALPLEALTLEEAPQEQVQDEKYRVSEHIAAYYKSCDI